MLYPLIGPRFHGWLDDLVVLTYVLGIFVLGLHDAALAVVVAGASIHFLNARLTDYPQGTIALYSFRTHAFIELAEGIVVLAVGLASLGDDTVPVRAFVIFMGASQFTAFAFSDYAYPATRARV